MGFPNKPWNYSAKDLTPPSWATSQIDYTTSSGESYSVWISPDFYQYFRGTSGYLETERNKEIEWHTIAAWKNGLINPSYFQVYDLQPIEENE